MYFAVEYVFHKWIDGTEVGYEEFSCFHIDSSAGDISEEFSDYMPISNYAKELLQQETEGVYKVFIAGTISYHQDYWGEIDSNTEFDMVSVRLLDKSADNYIEENSPDEMMSFN